MIDVTTVGSLFIELTPTAPGETLATAHRYTLVAGGAAANVVFALARLGVGVRFISAVGDDEFGTLAIDELRAFGVDAMGVRRVAGQLTPVTFASIDGRGGKQFRFYRFPGCAHPMEALTAADFAGAGACRVFDFSEGSLRDAALRPLVFQAARDARAAGACVLYAVNLRRASWHAPDAEIAAVQREAAALADVVVLNEEETLFVSGAPGEAGLRALQALGPRVVVQTRGGDGEMLLRAGDATRAVPLYRVPVVYDVGAGDTFHAGLLAAALRGDVARLSADDWAQAVRFGAATAAIRVSTSADPRDLPGYDDVQAWMRQRG
jgi:sugar/nucleoside kinase (ribokinase family)